jgi:hypothetical protein
VATYLERKAKPKGRDDEEKSREDMHVEVLKLDSWWLIIQRVGALGRVFREVLRDFWKVRECWSLRMPGADPRMLIYKVCVFITHEHNAPESQEDHFRM